MARGTTKERNGRSATSLQHVLHKRKRYDPTDAKRQRFYTAAKHFKSYQRLRKKEGLAHPQPSASAAAPDEDGEDDEQKAQPFENSDRKRRREERDDVERKEDEQEEGAGAEEGEADVRDEQGRERGPVKRRKQKRKAAPVVKKSKQQIQAEQEARARALAEAKEARMSSFKRHMTRTKKGQPIMANLMEDLLTKLRKQKQPSRAPTPRSSPPAAAS